VLSITKRIADCASTGCWHRHTRVNVDLQHDRAIGVLHLLIDVWIDHRHKLEREALFNKTQYQS